MEEERRRKKSERAAKIRKEKQILDARLKKDYNEYVKKNGGWPTAKDKQTVIREIR